MNELQELMRVNNVIFEELQKIPAELRLTILCTQMDYARAEAGIELDDLVQIMKDINEMMPVEAAV